MGLVLLVEDDAITRKILARGVSSIGHSPVEASSGTLALDILKDNPEIRLLITDLLMPGLDGRELVRRVRNLPLHAEMPIIMVSGQVKLSEINEVLLLGASRFLPKPVNTQDLALYVEHLLRLSEAKKIIPVDDEEMKAVH